MLTAFEEGTGITIKINIIKHPYENALDEQVRDFVAGGDLDVALTDLGCIGNFAENDWILPLADVQASFAQGDIAMITEWSAFYSTVVSQTRLRLRIALRSRQSQRALQVANQHLAGSPWRWQVRRMRQNRQRPICLFNGRPPGRMRANILSVAAC